MVLVIWLNENIHIYGLTSKHGVFQVNQILINF